MRAGAAPPDRWGVPYQQEASGSWAACDAVDDQVADGRGADGMDLAAR